MICPSMLITYTVQKWSFQLLQMNKKALKAHQSTLILFQCLNVLLLTFWSSTIRPLNTRLWSSTGQLTSSIPTNIGALNTQAFLVLIKSHPIRTSPGSTSILYKRSRTGYRTFSLLIPPLYLVALKAFMFNSQNTKGFIMFLSSPNF